MKQKPPRPRQSKTGRRWKGTAGIIQKMTAEEAIQDLYSEEWFQALIGREVSRRVCGESDALPVLPAAVELNSPKLPR